MSHSQKLRDLPAVHEVLDELAPLLAEYPRALIISEIRRALEAARATVLAGKTFDPDIARDVRKALSGLKNPSLRTVINATGVVLHTNLGRAPLISSVVPLGYTNLEYDLATGRRGKRDVHAGPLLERLTGAAAIAVNNNAAAVFLALHELASGGEAIVSRGELIEIGDGFRIPDIMARSGATLREVGTTNRTRIEDYRDAINDRTRLLMRVHPSNFRITGFTARPELRELAALGHERGIPVYEDLGSGCIVDLRAFGIEEPLVSDSLGAGVDLVSFSGDKLLGGPQAGILAGRAELVARLRRNPLFRALRLDKLTYEVLGNTLRSLLLERWDEVPALAMIRLPAERIRERAMALLAHVDGLSAEVIAGESVIGGGATPDQAIPTWLIAIECANVVEAERSLRTREDPVVARIEGGRLILDLRTVLPWEEDCLLRALTALGRHKAPPASQTGALTA
ncbi:MAG: L-seryl-tRNA(Sec) selenium transferase [Candidatus Solibacter sp.]